jgi:hypothetical protein
MRKLTRTIQAFFEALKLTLQGNTLDAPTRYPRLSAWADTGVKLTRSVFASADTNGLSEERRKQLSLRVEGRDTSMQTILAAVEHNLTREYPMLMETLYEHNLTTLYAMNMNDQYRVSQLAESGLVQSEPTRQAIQALADHLRQIPPSKAAPQENVDGENG